MIRIKDIKLVLGGALVLPVAIASIACSAIYADDPNGVNRETFIPEVDLKGLNSRIQSAIESFEISQAKVDTGTEILQCKLSIGPNTGFNPRWDMESIKAEIAAAVESGEITQEEASYKNHTIQKKKKK